ncbi:MAG: NHLP bacteriocin system secretion protein [Candidatus Scalindua sp.]|nr:NHLP bacteriocin system secretion protein [Candidatus Scalindua sp.]
MDSKVFRKVSLERMSSPEQLDQMMQVTTPKGWVVLLALIILVVFAIFWGIFGSISTKVTGMGILIKRGGVFNIGTDSHGLVLDLKFAVGETVHKGDLVAIVDQPDLSDQLESAKVDLQELNVQEKQLADYESEDLKINASSLVNEQENLEFSIKSDEDKLKWLKARSEARTELLKEGLVTKQDLIDIKEQINSTELSIDKSRNELKKVSIKRLDAKHQREEDLLDIQQQIETQNQKIFTLEEDLDRSSNITSPYTGTVLEIMVDVGEETEHTSPILNLELTGESFKHLESVIYVAAANGKKVKTGMDVQVSPTTVKAEEYGFIKGKVSTVAEFPSTDEGMMRVLQNSKLVTMLSGNSAPIEIFAELLTNDKTVSGYEWSSPKGPPLTIHGGTICTTSITVRKQPPISLVIPLLRKYLLGYND